MKRAKQRILIFCLACFLFLSAEIFRRLDIWEDAPLIDLEAILTAENVGKPGSTDNGSSVKPTEEKEDHPGSVPQEKTNNPSVQVVINVRDTRISVDGIVFDYDREKGYAEGFEDIIKEFSNRDVLLQDYYAEAHAYRYVLEKLEGTLKKKTQLKQGTIGDI